MAKECDAFMRAVLNICWVGLMIAPLPEQLIVVSLPATREPHGISHQATHSSGHCVSFRSEGTLTWAVLSPPVFQLWSPGHVPEQERSSVSACYLLPSKKSLFCDRRISAAREEAGPDGGEVPIMSGLNWNSFELDLIGQCIPFYISYCAMDLNQLN